MKRKQYLLLILFPLFLVPLLFLSLHHFFLCSSGQPTKHKTRIRLVFERWACVILNFDYGRCLALSKVILFIKKSLISAFFYFCLLPIAFLNSRLLTILQLSSPFLLFTSALSSLLCLRSLHLPSTYLHLPSPHLSFLSFLYLSCLP